MKEVLYRVVQNKIMCFVCCGFSLDLTTWDTENSTFASIEHGINLIRFWEGLKQLQYLVTAVVFLYQMLNVDLDTTWFSVW